MTPAIHQQPQPGGPTVRWTATGPTILLNSGRYFNLLEPESSQIDYVDIAAALSKLCRFCGHTRAFYSVAQHSLLVSRLVPATHVLEALLHDATEAFVGDVTRPLKQLLPEYQRIEQRIDAVIRRQFCLPPEMSPEVKRADLVALACEQRDLMPDHDDIWPCLEGITALPGRIIPSPPGRAYIDYVTALETALREV